MRDLLLRVSTKGSKKANPTQRRRVKYARWKHPHARRKVRSSQRGSHPYATHASRWKLFWKPRLYIKCNDVGYIVLEASNLMPKPSHDKSLISRKEAA